MLKTAELSSSLRVNRLLACTKAYCVVSSFPTRECRLVNVSSLKTLKLLLFASYESSMRLSFSVFAFFLNEVAVFCSSVFSLRMSSQTWERRVL